MFWRVSLRKFSLSLGADSIITKAIGKYCYAPSDRLSTQSDQKKRVRKKMCIQRFAQALNYKYNYSVIFMGLSNYTTSLPQDSNFRALSLEGQFILGVGW